MKMRFWGLMFLLGLMGAADLQVQAQNKLSRSEQKKGWKLLFDGKSTEGWTTTAGQAVPEGWIVEDGTLGTRAGGKAGDIMTKGEYGNFELTMEYTVDSGANSGLKYFYTQYTEGGKLGMEYQLLDDKNAEDNKEENHLTGSFYDVLAPSKVRKKLMPPGQWNKIRIVCQGKLVQHWLNDYKILEFNRQSKDFADAVAESKFNKTLPVFGTVDKGHILLQEHGGTAYFRNIKIRLL